MIVLNINRGQRIVHMGAEYNLWKEITVAAFYHIYYTKHKTFKLLQAKNIMWQECPFILYRLVSPYIFMVIRAALGCTLKVFCGDNCGSCVMSAVLTRWQTTLSVDWWIGAWHGFISFFGGEGTPLCNSVSPVKKSTDDADSHQQLNHQGQVDFSYETCSERKTQTHSETRQIER